MGRSAGRRALRQTQVLVHATRYVAKRASYEGPLLVSHTFHEETVVRHEDERARPAVEPQETDGHKGTEQGKESNFKRGWHMVMRGFREMLS